MIPMTDAETVLIAAAISAALWSSVCIVVGLWFVRYAASGRLFSAPRSRPPRGAFRR